MGRLSRTKGASFEREVAAAFRAAGFTDARRGLSQTRDGSEVPDVEGVPELWIECKHRIHCNVQAALKQAEWAMLLNSRCSWRNLAAVTVTKDNRAEPIASLYLRNFLELLRRLREAEARAVYMEAALKEARENSEKGAA